MELSFSPLVTESSSFCQNWNATNHRIDFLSNRLQLGTGITFAFLNLGRLLLPTAQRDLLVQRELQVYDWIGRRVGARTSFGRSFF